MLKLIDTLYEKRLIRRILFYYMSKLKTKWLMYFSKGFPTSEFRKNTIKLGMLDIHVQLKGKC